MTGDGVNDALALKDADIGVAMGNGAQATKAVAQLVLLDGRFSHLPNVLAEGRRVIGNVERVANLFVAKNVMSLIAIITAALFTLPFPFLPRHLTLVSAVTIGIPAFFLALGPNKRRYVPGFLKRVLRFAVPAGAVSGTVVFVSYLLARAEVGAPPASECLVQTEGSNVTDNVVCWQPSTAATIALLFTCVLDPGGAVPAVPAVEGRAGRVDGRPWPRWPSSLRSASSSSTSRSPRRRCGPRWRSARSAPLAIEIIYRTEPGMRAAAGT